MKLLSEVDGWTHLADHFVHLRTLAPPKHRHALLTAVLADGINLGLARMSEACRAMSWRQLTWTADWHVRDECYARALAELIDAQHRQPLSAHWGAGTTSSSDAQFFRAGARGEVRSHAHPHYGPDPGVKFYTHLSDQFGPYHTNVIAATAHEAPHVLDGLLYHESSLVIDEHYTDTGGFSDHLFAVCRLLGFRYANSGNSSARSSRSTGCMTPSCAGAAMSDSTRASSKTLYDGPCSSTDSGKSGTARTGSSRISSCWASGLSSVEQFYSLAQCIRGSSR